jgi:nickel-dependent lactate racemase
MRVHLAYGKHGLDVELPPHAQVIVPRYVPRLPDAAAAIRQALRAPIGSPPLRELVRRGDRVVVVHSDLTRPMPNERVLPLLLVELEAAGVRRDDVTLLNALGTHRRQTPQELAGMLGQEIVARYRCLQHDAWDEKSLVSLGHTSFGHPVRVNRTYLEADVKILTGFIEPHLFAGFSGGPKGVLPSIAGFDSVLSNHSARMIGHPQATWGVTQARPEQGQGGNPVWEEMLEVALKTEPTFLLNVTLSPGERDASGQARAISGVFAGDLRQAHAAGCDFCRASAMVPVPHFYDVVITTNSGYPLDMNLYQAVKGMSAAARIVRQGGSIIAAAECWDGIPEHGEYANLLRAADSLQGLLERVTAPGFACHDQWEAHVQALIQLRADVYVYSDGLSDEQIRAALLLPCQRIEDTLAKLLERYGPGATVCVLPEGPQTVPFVTQDEGGAV